MLVPRPTVLLAEPEPGEALSVRKLVIETAKFNVLTAHSAQEAMLSFQKFPAVEAIVLHVGLAGYDEVALEMKQLRPDIPLVVLRPNAYQQSEYADYHLSSHSPEELVEFLRTQFGDPRVSSP